MGLVLAAGLAIARPPPPRVAPGFGLEGSIDCVRAWTPSRLAATTAFVHGFWTGANNATRAAVGQTMTLDGVMDAVRERCRRSRYELLVGATAGAYAEARARGR